MPQPELDIVEIEGLLSTTLWWAAGRPEVDARRLATAAGLAWMAGARVREMARLRRADWRPGGQPAVRLTPEQAGISDRRKERPRLIPVLPALARLVEARLADMPGAGAEALLLSREEPWDASPRGFLESHGKDMAALTDGLVPSFADLRGRFRRYVAWGRPDPALAAWLGGSTFRAAQPGDEYEPSLRDLAALLRAAHPMA